MQPKTSAEFTVNPRKRVQPTNGPPNCPFLVGVCCLLRSHRIQVNFVTKTIEVSFVLLEDSLKGHFESVIILSPFFLKFESPDFFSLRIYLFACLCNKIFTETNNLFPGDGYGRQGEQCSLSTSSPSSGIGTSLTFPRLISSISNCQAWKIIYRVALALLHFGSRA